MRALLAITLTVAALGVGGCKRWKGADLSEGHSCATSPESRCAAGLFCDLTMNGREEPYGNARVVLGRCMPRKSAGATCADDGDCAPPNRCNVPEVKGVSPKLTPHYGTKGVCGTP